MSGSGKQLRIGRLFRQSDDRAFIVPMDHTISDGPIGSAGCTTKLVELLAAHGADAVVLHKGRVRIVEPKRFRQLALILHLSASTALGVDVNDKVLVGSVEEALELGADAVSVHVNLGSPTESQQLRDVGKVSDACARWGMPLLAMMYARGPDIDHPTAPETLAHLTAVAVDLGADVVKTQYSGSPETMGEVVATCPIPLLVAGGGLLSDSHALLVQARDAIACGAQGLAVGRNVFQSRHPGDTITTLSHLVHGSAEIDLQVTARPSGSRVTA
jgi:2-amino-4,5-dihydroxy-6-oxo-7-(phosphooxy)heptanoate synthase